VVDACVGSAFWIGHVSSPSGHISISRATFELPRQPLYP